MPSSNLSKTSLETNPTLEKGTKINNSPKTQNTESRGHEEYSLEKNFHRHFQKIACKFIVAPTPHYFFSSHRTGPHQRLTRAPDGTSCLTIAPGPIQAPDPILTPGNKDTLIPVLTLSPIIAPSFLRPVSTHLRFTIDTIDASSNLRLAVIVPAPNEHPAPTILSPTYDK